jgi:hypothetical protein
VTAARASDDDTPTIGTAIDGGPAAIAGGIGAMAACCILHMLILAGVVAGLGGVAIGGIAAGVGVATTAIVWVIVTLLRCRA